MIKTFITRTESVIADIGKFIRANWQGMAEREKFMRVRIDEFTSKRSLEQNAFYWKLLEQIAAQAYVGGRLYDKEVWHEQFKRTFIGTYHLPFGGVVGISTRTLSVSQFSEYLEKVQAYVTQELQVAL